MIRTTITTTQRRRASSSNLQQSTAVILFILSLGMQSYYYRNAVSAFSSSSIISRRGILNTAFFSSSHRGVGVVHQSIISSTTIDRRRISLSSSRLYTATTTTTTLQTATDNNVVELQYSEFLPPKRNDDDNDDNSSVTHPPVIFLHGLLGNKRNFASLASSLSSQLDIPRPIYTIDLRNHGENTHDWRSSMSYSEMARDVLAFMDKISDNSSEAASATNGQQQQQQKAVLVGHSMGGKVAQSLALMYPERVAGLVVLDIAPVRYYSDQSSSGGGGGGGGGDDGSGWKAVEEIVRSVASIDLTDEQFTTKRDVDAVLRNGMLEDAALRAFVLTNLEQLRKDDVGNDVPPLRWKIHWDGIVNELDRIAGFDVHDEIMDDSVLTVNGNEEGEERMNNNTQGNNIQYEGDVFFIHGGASRFVRHSFLPTIASYFPNHMLTTIRGVGHWVHAEAPDDTIALLKQYLDR